MSRMPKRKQRQIVVRLDPELETELENAQARLGADYSPITRAALRKYLRTMTLDDINEDVKEDQRRKYARETVVKQTAKRALEELNHVTR